MGVGGAGDAILTRDAGNRAQKKVRVPSGTGML